jgi:hypothetical protein
VFLACLFLFRLQAIMVAAELVELDSERVSLRLDSSVLKLEGFQPGAQPLVFLVNCRMLDCRLRSLFLRVRLRISRPGPFRLNVKLVEQMGFLVCVPDIRGHFLDFRHEELVIALPAPDVVTGPITAHA